MEVIAVCRTCHKEWVISVLHKNKLNYECPPCEKKRLRKKWLHKKKKAYPVGQDQGKRITNKPILLYSIEEGLVND